jgi:subtilisin-like proprotein convertase family protein
MGSKWQMHLELMNRTLASRLALLMFLSKLALMNLGGPRIASAAAVYQNSNTRSITINDNGSAAPYPSAITFAGVVGNVIKVTVTLHNITHIEPSDIDIMLQCPSGLNAVIMSDAGDAVSVSNVTITLDDAAGAPPPFTPPGLTSGTFQPVNYIPPAFPLADPDNFGAPAPAPSTNVALSTFNGVNPNGVWNLWVVDSVASTGGSIGGGWTLTITTDAPTAATVVAFGGTRFDDRVQLNWRTSGEVDNLGFQLFRDAGQGRELITAGLVVGSALQMGNATLSTELSYAGTDMLEPGTGAVQYWLEDIDIQGQRTSHGPIVPQVVGGSAPVVQPATLLSMVGRRAAVLA